MKNPTSFKVRRQYEAVLDALEPPSGASNQQFRGVMTLLYLIAHHYPNACPGQATLARKAMVDERTIRRWVAKAIEWDWLFVLPDAGVRSKWSLSYTNRYFLTAVSELELEHGERLSSRDEGRLSSCHEGRMSSKHRSTSYFHENKEPSAEQPSVVHPSSRAACGRTTLGEVDKSRAEEIAAAAGDRRATKRDGQWIVILHGAWPLLPPTVGEPCSYGDTTAAERSPRRESIGHTVGYIRTTFLAPAAGRVYTEDEVRTYIDQFIEAIRRSMVQVKANQSAFMRFTGWWGREGKVHHTRPSAREYFDKERLTDQGHRVLESRAHREFPQGQWPRPWTWGNPGGLLGVTPQRRLSVTSLVIPGPGTYQNLQEHQQKAVRTWLANCMAGMDRVGLWVYGEHGEGSTYIASASPPSG